MSVEKLSRLPLLPVGKTVYAYSGLFKAGPDDMACFRIPGTCLRLRFDRTIGAFGVMFFFLHFPGYVVKVTRNLFFSRPLWPSRREDRRGKHGGSRGGGGTVDYVSGHWVIMVLGTSSRRICCWLREEGEMVCRKAAGAEPAAIEPPPYGGAKRLTPDLMGEV